MCIASATPRDHPGIRQLEAVQTPRWSEVQVNNSSHSIISSMRLPRIGIMRRTRPLLASLFALALGLAQTRCLCDQCAARRRDPLRVLPVKRGSLK